MERNVGYFKLVINHFLGKLSHHSAIDFFYPAVRKETSINHPQDILL